MITPADFLAIAQQLSGSNEAELRTAVSRAYYAAFHQAQATAEKFTYKPNPKSKSSHQDLMNFLARFGDPDYKTAADSLKRARRLRKKADYRLSDGITAEDAQTCIDLAQQVFELCP